MEINELCDRIIGDEILKALSGQETALRPVTIGNLYDGELASSILRVIFSTPADYTRVMVHVESSKTRRRLEVRFIHEFQAGFDEFLELPVTIHTLYEMFGPLEGDYVRERLYWDMTNFVEKNRDQIETIIGMHKL